MNIWIYIALYWLACCITGYVIRTRLGKGPVRKAGIKAVLWEHLQIILLCPIAVPVLLSALLYKGCRSLYYKNRPRPLPKKFKKYMKKDCVLDENNSTISIAEYNYKHGTEYTLDDVYGKGYIESLSEEEKAEINADATSFGILEIQENIPETIYTEAAKTLGEALLSGDFVSLESQLDENVEHVSYKKETISGKDKVVDYWKGWRSRYVETRKAKKFEVVYSNYYSNACLLLDMMVVMFLIRDNRISKILLIQRHLSPTIGYHDDILDFPFDLDSIRHCLTDLREPNDIVEPVVTENRIPCFSCGKASEELEWHSSLFQFGDIGYSGIVSVCPHCHRVVEHEPIIRYRYHEPVDPHEEKCPIPHKLNKTDYNPCLFGIRNFEGGEPLKGTKYLEGLSGETRQAAEESNWFLLHMTEREDLERVKKCYYAALDDGISEAANILGILAYNFEGKTEEGEKLLQKGVDGGSHNAMLNLFTVLWSEGKYEEAINHLSEVNEKPSPSLKCLWNLAFFYYMGNDFAHNTIRKKNIGVAKKILKKIQEKDGDLFYNEEKSVFKTTKDFLKYIDEGNIFASKAKNYLWRIKTNLDSLNKKGDDAVFWDLDALSLEKGYHLGLRVAEHQGMGDESNFYVYDANGEEDKDLLKYICMDETAMGAWQVYLLMTSPTLLPTFWHGGYIERRFILKEKDLYEIEPLQCFALSDLTKQGFLYPSVEIDDNAGTRTAHINCCYWNDWKGIVREHVEIKMCNGKVTSYEEKDTFVIYKYDCGILF
jgi:tetratricopeptide (TPR) repeat protein